jgi:hypothetical protein
MLEGRISQRKVDAADGLQNLTIWKSGQHFRKIVKIIRIQA